MIKNFFVATETFTAPVNLHWTDGGTGVTNFDKKNRARYERAVEIYGDKNLVICDLPLPFQGQAEPCAYGVSKYHSLHHLHMGDLSLFWRIYNGLKTLIPDTEPVADPYAELKAAQKAGETIQVKWDGSDCWCDWVPDWSLSVDHYRIKPEVRPRQAEVDAVRAAYESGKACEWRSGDQAPWFKVGDTYTWDDWDWKIVLQYNQPVRVKPEPRLRPWKTEEVPVGALVRNNGKKLPPDGCVLIIASGGGGVKMISNGELKDVPFDILTEQGEHSTDGGKTWSPCGVVEQV
jgi:hypothetical protein